MNSMALKNRITSEYPAEKESSPVFAQVSWQPFLFPTLRENRNNFSDSGYVWTCFPNHLYKLSFTKIKYDQIQDKWILLWVILLSDLLFLFPCWGHPLIFLCCYLKHGTYINILIIGIITHIWALIYNYNSSKKSFVSTEKMVRFRL